MNQAVQTRSYRQNMAVQQGIASLQTAIKHPLTVREQDVLALLACGLQNKEIAKVLTISPNTVAGYLKDIYRKLLVNNRTAATFVAIEMGLLKSQTAPAVSVLA